MLILLFNIMITLCTYSGNYFLCLGGKALKIHIVQKGDTLWNIAKKYGVDFEEVKNMNTQLSNPDLIMPGMKIKVPSGNVAVKKEAPIQQGTIKKEMPLTEHPFAKEKPKAVVEVEDTKPKEPVTEKPSKPYIPPVPNVQHPVYTGLDVNNYYTVNMAMMPQMANPQLPPKPANVLPDMTKMDEEVPKEKYDAKTEAPQPYYLPQEQHHDEEEYKDMANMPNVPNMQHMQMPTYTQPAMYQPQPQYVAPQYMVPVSPVLPGSGLCPPYYPMQMPYQYGPSMMPNQAYQQPYPTAVSPAEYEDDDDMDYDHEQMGNMPNMPYQQQAVAPAHYAPGFPVNPYAGVPVSPVLPGTGLGYPNQVMGAYGEAPEGYDQMPNMPYPQQTAPAYDDKDCGCGGPAPQFPQQGYGYPMAQPYGGYPMYQPMNQGYAPYGQNPYGYAPQQGVDQQQMFGMPNFEREEEED